MSTAIAERAPDATASTPTNVYQCIVGVSAELAREGIAKTRNNAQQGYKFRGIEEVMNALAPLLARYGLVILPRMLSRELTERATKNGGVLFSVTVAAEFDFVSAADGSKHTVKTYGEAMDSADKATNKAMSAAYKYAAFQTFCIPTEGDNDADAQTHEIASRYPKAEPVIPMSGRREGGGPQEVVASGTVGLPANSSDNGPDLAVDLPPGSALIERIDVTDTKNPNVKKHLLTMSTGETFSTINTKFAERAVECKRRKMPVYVEGHDTKWGKDLDVLVPVESWE